MLSSTQLRLPRQQIGQIVNSAVVDPIGPEFIPPPQRP
jgi:hypothetical protein